MKTRRLGAAMAAVMALAPAIFAQAPDLSGTWALQSETTTVPNDSGGTSTLTGSATTVTLKQSGDAVTGTWTTVKTGEWPIKGRLQGNSFELETEPRDVPVTRNGEKGSMKAHWIFRGAIEDDALRGTMSLVTETGNTLSQPFTATRKR